MKITWNNKNVTNICFIIVFNLVCNRGHHGGVLEHIKIISFRYFQLCWSAFSIFCAGLDAGHSIFYSFRAKWFSLCFEITVGKKECSNL